MGFKLRLTELEKGAVNVVVQPGQWPTPRVDHLGLVLDEAEFETALERAERNELRVQEHGGRRTFVSTNAGYRLAPPSAARVDRGPSRAGRGAAAVGAAPEGRRPDREGEGPRGDPRPRARRERRRDRRHRRPLRPRRPPRPPGALRRALRLEGTRPEPGSGRGCKAAVRVAGRGIAAREQPDGALSLRATAGTRFRPWLYQTWLERTSGGRLRLDP